MAVDLNKFFKIDKVVDVKTGKTLYYFTASLWTYGVNSNGSQVPIKIAEVMIQGIGNPPTRVPSSGTFYIGYQGNGTFWLVVKASGYQTFTSQKVSVSSNKSPIDFGVVKLEPIIKPQPKPTHKVILSFQAIDKYSKPIPNISLILHNVPFYGSLPITADSNGHFSFSFNTTSVNDVYSVNATIAYGWATVHHVSQLSASVKAFPNQLNILKFDVDLSKKPSCPSWGKLIQAGMGPTCIGMKSPCSPGYGWDPKQQKCVDASNWCPKGQLWIPTTGLCIIDRTKKAPITVYVKDSKTKTGIANAVVEVRYGSHQKAYTNSAGEAVIDVLIADDYYYVKAYKDGYSTSGWNKVYLNKSVTIYLTQISPKPGTKCPTSATGTYPNCICPDGYQYQRNSNSCVKIHTEPKTSLLIINGVFDKANKNIIEEGEITLKHGTKTEALGFPTPSQSFDVSVVPGQTYTLICTSPNYKTFSTTFTATTSNKTITIYMTPKQVMKCPANSSGTYPNCTCTEKGYTYSYAKNECVAPVKPEVECPENSTGTYPNCKCSQSGYEYNRKLNACIPPKVQKQCPTDATGVYPNCTCTDSTKTYDASKNQCIARQVQKTCPTDATGTYPNCTCTDSTKIYDSSKNQCIAQQKQCPADATGTYPNCMCTDSTKTYDTASNSCISVGAGKKWYEEWYVWAGIIAAVVLFLLFRHKK